MEAYLEHLSKSMSEITQTIKILKKSKPYDEVLVAHLQEVHRALVYTCRELGEQRRYFLSGKLKKRIRDEGVKNAFGGKIT